MAFIECRGLTRTYTRGDTKITPLDGLDLVVCHEVFMNEKRLQGSMMGSNSFRVDMPRYVDMYLDGRLMLDEMISRHISLEEINDGYEMMRQRVGARTVIDFS